MGLGICCRNSPVSEEDNLNEMKNGILPNNPQNQIQENNIDLKLSSSYNFISKNNKKETIDTDYLNTDQQKSEIIFLYFNKIRTNPINYLSEAQKYNLSQTISTASEKANKGIIKNLIKNPFYDLFFEKCVKASSKTEENILDKIEKENLFKTYEKKLYIIEGNNDNVEECVWLLIKKCYDNGDDILQKNIAYLVHTVISSEDNSNKFIGFFLFLSNIKEDTNPNIEDNI